MARLPAPGRVQINHPSTRSRPMFQWAAPVPKKWRTERRFGHGPSRRSKSAECPFGIGARTPTCRYVRADK
jgi:hypothetical protein